MKEKNKQNTLISPPVKTHPKNQSEVSSSIFMSEKGQNPQHSGQNQTILRNTMIIMIPLMKSILKCLIA